MAPRRIVVATHGHCFDGMASAALFVVMLRRLRGEGAQEFRFLSCGYGPQMSMVPEGWLDGDENAILDFRYTPTPRLTWYFDHHLTAFGSDEERAAALAGAATGPEGAPQVHHDAARGSCTVLLADVAARVFGVDLGDMSELIRWADLIDTAGFPSAADAVRRDEPVLQLASVVEQHGDRAFLDTIVPMLASRPVGDVARDPWVQSLWAPIEVARGALVSRVQARSRRVGSVVVTDLTDTPADLTAKFVSYALYPDCVYSVTLSRVRQHFKLAVGYNPWCGAPRRHNIAAICKRYGGGGHPAVGATTFRLADEALARAAVEDIARELA